MIDRRYFKRISRYLADQERQSLESINELDAEDWFDYWHIHPDWKARGNRVRSLVALTTYRLLQQAEAHVACRREPVQAWALLHENTGDTAVYLHSPNPNGSPFPYAFEGVEWGVSEPEEVRGILKASHEIGRQQLDGEVIYVIRARI